jgi:6,7-dimethyl-8-ribityllumazine synthase
MNAKGKGNIDGGEVMNLAIVVSEFNFDITMMMLEQAKIHAKFLGANVKKVITVPGVYDIPLAVKEALKRKDIDGIVTLGAVIEGSTDHDQIVMQHASRKIVDLALEFNKPVALGISGPGMTRLQAQDRIDKAKNAVEACVKMFSKLKEIRE